MLPDKSNQTKYSDAISHFNYGIAHDIFKEPIRTYAQIAAEACEKQIKKKPVPDTDDIFGVGKCPNCQAPFLGSLTRCCGNCGQAIDWSGLK